MYCLDALPMLFAIFLLNIWHPGRCLVGPDSEFPKLTRAEKKALKREKKERKRRRKEAKRRGGDGDGRDVEEMELGREYRGL
jgi:hypothetical protein